MTRIFPPFLCALLAVSFALFCGGCRDRTRVLALVLAVKGEVAIVEAAGGNLSPGAVIAAPSTIRTAADGTLVFSPLPGVMIRLEAGGEMQIDRLALRKRGEDVTSREAILQLRKGSARVWVDAFRQGTIDVRIQSRAGDAVARGPVLAEFAMEPDGGARVICVSGSLSAAGTMLSAGQWAEFAPGQNAPGAQVAADTEAVWRTLLEVRNLEPQLLDLQTRQRNRTPVRAATALDAVPKN